MENKVQQGSFQVELAKMPTTPATGLVEKKPTKRAKKDESSGDDLSDNGSADGHSGSGSGMPNGGGKDDGSRMALRKEKKSAREKARRQRENALFEELANMCSVPADTRDKSSVLKAVIKKVEEMRTKGPGSFPPGLVSALPRVLTSASSFSSISTDGTLPTSGGGLDPSMLRSTDYLPSTAATTTDDVRGATGNWGAVPNGFPNMQQLYSSFPQMGQPAFSQVMPSFNYSLNTGGQLPPNIPLFSHPTSMGGVFNMNMQNVPIIPPNQDYLLKAGDYRPNDETNVRQGAEQ